MLFGDTGSATGGAGAQLGQNPSPSTSSRGRPFRFYSPPLQRVHGLIGTRCLLYCRPLQGVESSPQTAKVKAFGPDPLDRRNDRQTNKQTNKQTNRQINKRSNQQTDKQTNRQTDKTINKRSNQQTDKQTNRQTDRRTDRQTNKRSNGQLTV